MSDSPVKTFRIPLAISSSLVFAVSFVIYMFTVDPVVSFWDCPEYVLTASKLEIGHPPGNPIWMLVMRIATIPFLPQNHALVINICSGIFMALASCFLAKIIFLPIRIKLSDVFPKIPGISDVIASFISAGAAFTFSFCDSAWFSAVEAEVYAMSAMLTSLSLWIMTLWWFEGSSVRRTRLLILVAYLIGLSLGVHQLNLLCIPVFVVIWLYRRFPDKINPFIFILSLFGSLALVGVILAGIMPGALEWASLFELFTVNQLGWPYHSGVIVYAVMFLALLILTLGFLSKFGKQISSPFIFLTVWLSGAFLFAGNMIICIIFSLLAVAAIDFSRQFTVQRVTIFLWMLGFIMLGYSSFGIIMIRANASPYLNSGNPDNIFSLSSYIQRDQYSSAPLIYGQTPFSKPLLVEEVVDNQPRYRKYLLKKGKKKYHPYVKGARLNHSSGFLTSQDSFLNEKVLKNKHGYLLEDYAFSHILTPELNMWFPRITSGTHISDYNDWAGMTPDNMEKIMVSETVDSTGNLTTKLEADGKRGEKYSYRPTYLQNLRYFLSYQVFYMYFRYLLWNFSGRQNDFHSTGEIEHGNFITGIPLLDNLMLGDQEALPHELGNDNPGHNVYFAIPFIIGIIGIFFLGVGKRTMRRADFLIFLFFFMTGIAIVIYLNQTPGEPRERDYTFLGSYMAFVMWIAAGILSLLTLFFKYIKHKAALLIISFIVAFLPATLLAITNFHDHDRSNRYEPQFFASSILDFDIPSVIFSFGDNLSFPLWYTTEILGKGRKHTIVDISYLALPSYMQNLRKQQGRALLLHGKEADINFGAFSSVSIPSDSTPLYLPKALEILYASTSGKPVFPTSRIILPRSAGDSLTVSLKNIAGKNYMSFKNLMLLDIIGSELISPEPRIIYFPSSMDYQFYAPLDSLLEVAPFGKIYAPHLSKQEIDSIFVSEIEKELLRLDSLQIKPHYSDPVTAGSTKRYRSDLIIAAQTLLDIGKPELAEKIVELLQFNFPFFSVPPGRINISGKSIYDLEEYSNLLNRLYLTTNKPLYLSWEDELNGYREKRNKEWSNYINSLSPSQRRLISK